MNYRPPVPQGMLHSARGRYADGLGTRNRSMEQFNTRSGNPNMPMFNTARNAMNAYSRQRATAPAMGGMAGRAPVAGFGMAPTKPAQSFNHNMRFSQPAAPQLATMPAFSQPPVQFENPGMMYSAWFGRELPIRVRG